MRKSIRGTSLLEATLAVALLATVMLAVAGSQLTMARTQRATVWRERALWLADARIERLHVAAGADDALAGVAAASLPGGVIAVEDGAGGMRYVVVRWRDDDGAIPPRCEGAQRSTKPPSCVRIPFRDLREVSDAR